MQMTLKQKYGEWALVTGASSGIGRAFARHLAAEGMNVILVARRKDRLQQLAVELQEKHAVQALAVALDLTSEGFMPELAEQVGSRDVGLLINNAGFGSVGFFADNDPEHEANMVRLHCLATTALAHHFIRPMLQRGKGGIIFVGSIVGVLPIPYIATYSATKAFDMFIGQALWYEMRGKGIDVLALAPGGTKTEFQRLTREPESPLAASPEAVVRTGMRALGKRPYVIHGWHNKFVAFCARFLPAKITLQLIGGFASRNMNI